MIEVNHPVKAHNCSSLLTLRSFFSWRYSSHTLSFTAIVLFSCYGLMSLNAAEKSYIELEGVLYGAKADDRGAIGGGEGYVDIITAGDFTVTNLDDLLEALSVAEPGQIVFIPGDLEIDLTARIYVDKLVIDVPEGVTLASDRGFEGSEGVLFTSDALDTPMMIRATGPNVRISGIRLRGPNPKQYLNHHERAFGPGGLGRYYYNRFPVSRGIVTFFPGLLVDNCEISAFSHAGIWLRRGEGHHIHHNYIHHCQYNGLGYGVAHDVAFSLIEYNLFNRNRHSIAGTGRPGSGYTARHNIEAGYSLSHCFDMHGGVNRDDGTDIAGTYIKIYNNTFWVSRTVIAIRGVPEEACLIYQNWFKKHEREATAIRASENTDIRNNAYGTEHPTVK